MLIKNETCVICHPIFFQFISAELRLNDNKFFIIPKMKKKKALKKRYFVSSLSI